MENSRGKNSFWKNSHDTFVSQSFTPPEEDASPAQLKADLERIQMLNQSLESQDKFVPPAISTIEEMEIGRLMETAVKIYRMGYPGLSFMGYYRKIIQKIVTLAIESSPEFFEGMGVDEKRKVLNWKMELPTEGDLYDQAYAYILGHVRSPHLYPGRDFGNVVDETVLLEGLRTKLKQIYAEYAAYFIQKAREQKK
jgi:hypothetical protein